MYNYGGYPYMSNYVGYYQQPYNNAQVQPTNNNNYQTQNQQSSANVPAQQPTYMPLTFVNSIEEVNKFIVSPNNSVYLWLNSGDKLFIKSCDSTGRYNTETYDLSKCNENSPKKANEQQKDFSKDFVSKQEFKEIETRLEGKLIKLQSEVDKLVSKRPNKEWF